MTNDEKERVSHALTDLLIIVSHTNVPTEIMREFESRNNELLAELIGEQPKQQQYRVIGFAPTRTEVN